MLLEIVHPVTCRHRFPAQSRDGNQLLLSSKVCNLSPVVLDNFILCTWSIYSSCNRLKQFRVSSLEDGNTYSSLQRQTLLNYSLSSLTVSSLLSDSSIFSKGGGEAYNMYSIYIYIHIITYIYTYYTYYIHMYIICIICKLF